MLESIGLMQRHNYDVLIWKEEQILNISKREEVVPRFKFASPLYYWEDHENEEFEQVKQKFEPLIHYLVEQKVAIQGIKMFKGIELILITEQETMILPKVEPIVVGGLVVVVIIRYNEPKFN